MKTVYNMMEQYSDDEDQCGSQGEQDFDYDDDDDGEEFDYDTIDFGDSESEESTSNMHPLLVQDIENVKQKYWERAVYYKKFQDLGDIDVELHVPGNYFDYDVAKAWKIVRKEDIIIRLRMDFKKYLDASHPKIEVFQLSQKEKFGIGIQMENIIRLFLGKVWNTFSNSPDAPAAANSDPGVKRLPSKDAGFLAMVYGIGIQMENIIRLFLGKVWNTFSNSPTAPAATNSDPGVKRLPSKDAGFLAMVYDYCHQRLNTLNEFCVVCDEPHVFNNGPTMLKPTVCGRDLCVFSFQTIGVMSDAAEDIATGPEVVDLLITMAKAACKSERRNLIFDPFPTVVDPMNPQSLALNPSKKDFNRCKEALSALDMQKLSRHLGPNLKETVESQDILAYPLLQWLISSNRSHIVKLPDSAQLSFMSTPHQFLLMSSPPAKEAIFRQYKAEHGSTFAFHGSRLENWHSIMRNGLISASGTKFQVNGAAYGNGIYLSPEAMLSYSYSGGYYLDNHPSEAGATSVSGSRFLDVSDKLICLALCEVITSPDLRKDHSVWVMPDADKVCTRFFFVYDKNTMSEQTVNTQEKKYTSKIREAVEYHQYK